VAGSITNVVLAPGRNGIKKIKATLTADASGVVTAAVAGIAFGRLVGFAYKATGSVGFAPVLTVTGDSGATIVSYDVAAAEKFGSTTTGDTTGGASEDLWTTGAVHGLVDGDQIVFTSITGNGAGGPTVGTAYYVDQKSTTTFVLTTDSGLTLVQNVGATDASAATWYKVGTRTAVYKRPSQVVTDNAGTAVTAAASAPNVNRDIFVAGKVKIGATGLGNLGTCEVHLIVDERVQAFGIGA
jgi:hypothetical protein